MKKCSTATLKKPAVRLAGKLTLGLLLGMCEPAVHATSECDWASDAPSEHQVQRGDTLWGIASLFLKNPWCWPQVWEINRDSVRDPHWIYPGQLILLDRLRGVLRMGLPEQRPDSTVHWSPAVRAQALEPQRVPVVAGPMLRLLSRTRLLDAGQLDVAPVIVGMTEGRALAGEGDSVFVRGDLGHEQSFDVVRPSAPVADPDTHDVLGLVSRKVGRVRLAASGTLTHRLVVTASEAEMQVGDRLVRIAEPLSSPPSIHASAAPAGKLASILHEGRWAGTNDLVMLNRGESHGIDRGSIVRVARHVRIRADEFSPALHASDEAQSIALLLVLGVTERMSVAMVMRSRDTITVGDLVLPP
ncbi:MAG: LysM peptidoglycan-binding domain-containing protein [Oxalobacteraceae bacterium]